MKLKSNEYIETHIIRAFYHEEDEAARMVDNLVNTNSVCEFNMEMVHKGNNAFLILLTIKKDA